MSCKHLQAARSASPDAPADAPRRCRLKADRNALVRMSTKHARQVKKTAAQIGTSCPFVDGERFSECDWYQV